MTERAIPKGLAPSAFKLAARTAVGRALPAAAALSGVAKRGAHSRPAPQMAALRKRPALSAPAPLRSSLVRQKAIAAKGAEPPLWKDLRQPSHLAKGSVKKDAATMKTVLAPPRQWTAQKGARLRQVAALRNHQDASRAPALQRSSLVRARAAAGNDLKTLRPFARKHLAGVKLEGSKIGRAAKFKRAGVVQRKAHPAVAEDTESRIP